MTATALYRLYDEHAALLYVGITSNPEARLAAHRHAQTWWPLVASNTVEWFETRLEAAKAEASAIRTEDPSKNAAQPAEDGLGGWSPIPGRRAEQRVRTVSFHVPDELWESFSRAVDRQLGPEGSTSRVLRHFIRWYVGEPGVQLPKRPAAEETAP